MKNLEIRRKLIFFKPQWGNIVSINSNPKSPSISHQQGIRLIKTAAAHSRRIKAEERRVKITEPNSGQKIEEKSVSNPGTAKGREEGPTQGKRKREGKREKKH